MQEAVKKGSPESRGTGRETFEARTGGHWFVKLLKAKGAEFVFGTSGAGMPDIQDAMVVEKPPKWIQGLHEFTTVCAAMGYSLAAERPGFALIDRAVGTQNAVGAFFAASLNSAPLVALATVNSPGIPMETGEEEYHYAKNTSQFLAPWLKWTTDINSLDTMAEDIEKAIHMAYSERQGPTYVTVRQDLMAKKIENGYALNLEAPFNSPTVPDDETVERIAKTLVDCGRPEIVVANTGRHPETVEPLIELAHTLGSGVYVKRDFMNYPRTDPLYLGLVRFPGLPKLMQGTDVVLGLELGLLPHVRFEGSVQVLDLTGDPHRRQEVHHGGDYGSGMFPASIRCVCDMGATIKKLAKAAGKQVSSGVAKNAIADRTAAVTEVHDKQVGEWRARAKRSLDSGKLDGWSMGSILNRNWSSDVLWVDGTFSFSEALSCTVELERPGTYFSNPSSHLGVVSGMAYGVALADRRYVDVETRENYSVGRISPSEKVVLCTVGDGDAVCGNIDSALWTCQHYGIGVLYLVMNNACWAAEWGSLERSSQHWTKLSRDYECLDLDEPRIDFAQIAKGFSVHASTVRTVEEFERGLLDALQHVRKTGTPALVDAQTDKFTPGPSVVP